MKKSFKVFVSIVCVCAIFISSYTPVLAASMYSRSEISLGVNDNQLIQMMRDMGLTDEEMSYIMKLEYERREKSTSGQISTMAFPKNPYIGQRHTERYSLHWSTITMTISGVAGALIKGGVGAGLALVLAGAIMNEYEERLDSKGVTITVQYVYGETNDGLLGWNVGPTDYVYFY